MYKKYSNNRIIIGLIIVIASYQCYKMSIVEGKGVYHWLISSNDDVGIDREGIINQVIHLLNKERLAELIHTLDQFSDKQLLIIMPTIVDTMRNTLSISEFVGFILEIANKNKDNSVLHDAIMKLLPESIDYAHCLYEIAQRKSTVQMPLIVAWMKKATKLSPCYGFQTVFEHALTKTVLYDDLDVLEFFIAYGVRLTARKASELLMIVVYEEKNPLFIPFLIKRGADINQVGYDGHTLISHAVYFNNVHAARLLLESGAYAGQSVSLLETELIAIARNNNQRAMIDLLSEYCAD